MFLFFQGDSSLSSSALKLVWCDLFSVMYSGDISGIAWAPRTIPNGNVLFTLLCDMHLWCLLDLALGLVEIS